MIMEKLSIKIYVIVLWDIAWRICDDKFMLMLFGCIYDYRNLLIIIYVIVLWDMSWRICDDELMLMIFGCI